MKIVKCILALGLVLASVALGAQAQTPAGPAGQAMKGMPPLPSPPPPGAPVINLEARQTTGQLTVPVDKSQLLYVDRVFGELSVGNQMIADVVPLTRNLIYVLGRQRGSTNLTISDPAGNLIAVVDVTVAFDVEALQRGLADVVPGEQVTIRPAGDALILSGQVSSTDRLRQVLAVAERYAPGGITNMLSVGGPQQVLLQVRFAEVQRSALKDIGANFLFQYFGNDSIGTVATGTGISPDAFGVLDGFLSDGLSFNLEATIDALERRGALRTLAEPNLVALSGDTASFLAGGQLPIPVASNVQAGGIPVITVQFKDFGVGLSFTPTVIGRETINLEVNTEVSSVDPTLAVEASGIRVPGLKVRRAKTTIEMKDGQSFSIAGLLQDDFQDNISQFPLLGNIPVLGALFRSTNFQHQQTELVVLITTRLVDPGIARNLASPTDSLVIPSPKSLFLDGKLEETPAPGGAAPASNPSGFVLP
jgi:pilus assembly protein CpaC